ncbi:zinc-ribbon domain-containing protein [Bacillus cereus]|nr:zinc-ribbon domain-containing protein [Bacillus cereus]
MTVSTEERQSLLITHPDVVNHWDYNRTKTCRPDDVFPESHRRVWWLCESGHSLFEPVRTRVKHGGCIKCIRIQKREKAFQVEIGYSFNHLQKNESVKLRDFFEVNDVSNMSLDEFFKINNASNVRLYNALRRVSIDSLEDLLECTYYDLSRIRNLGIASQRELHKILNDYFKGGKNN